MRGKTTPALPTVSFIIPTLNAAGILTRCLEAIRNQDYPQHKVEIIVADAYSTDSTREIAKRYGAIVTDNPEILHEPGKTHASKIASGELLFFTDADNILATTNWLRAMVLPYQENPSVVGFLPQTVAPPDSSALNRYLGYLFTDPLTWFIYGSAANPHDYTKVYRSIKSTNTYQLYRFSVENHPLFGLSQGSGIVSKFDRDGLGHADDILSGIKLIAEGGTIAYIPSAHVYHYHVENLGNFLAKYRWRIRNNFTQKVQGMGMMNRLTYFNLSRRLRLLLFIPYSLSIVFPLIDALLLAIKWKDAVMLWHLPTCFSLACVIVIETIRHYLGLRTELGQYGGKS